MKSLIKKIMKKPIHIWQRRFEYLLLLKGFFRKPTVGLHTNCADNVIVSLTTYDKRIHKVHITIESLFQQRIRPEKIILWLYREEIGELSWYLKFQQKRGLQIRFLDENLKSFKKLIYAYEEFPDKSIVTVDDDIIYPNYWLEKMLVTSKENKQAIVCYRSKELALATKNKLTPYKSLPYSTKHAEASHHLLPIGCSGVLYPPKSLHPFVLDKKVATELCNNADDIWFKIMALLNKSQAVLVLPESIHFPLIEATQDDSLHKSNNVENLDENESKNDKALKNTIDYVNNKFDINLYQLLEIKEQI